MDFSYFFEMALLKELVNVSLGETILEKMLILLLHAWVLVKHSSVGSLKRWDTGSSEMIVWMRAVPIEVPNALINVCSSV
jgi:hypothetical protein